MNQGAECASYAAALHLEQTEVLLSTISKLGVPKKILTISQRMPYTLCY